jgi:3-methyladenine DNA glycosylase AlkD
MRSRDILDELRSMADPSSLEGMARYGIATDSALGGISVPTIRTLAKRIGHDHSLASELWASGIHEARILAGLVDDPAEVTENQMEAWASEFDSWDVVDGTCCNLFDRTPYAHTKALEWSRRDEEFVKRAAFSLMAGLAVHDKAASNQAFRRFFPPIEREAGDGRNFVRKAVSWALRQIGKRNLTLNRDAIALARRIQRTGPRSARWVASDALRELQSDAVLRRLREKANPGTTQPRRRPLGHSSHPPEMAMG